jgi:hypothetical protein
MPNNQDAMRTSSISARIPEENPGREGNNDPTVPTMFFHKF